MSRQEATSELNKLNFKEQETKFQQNRFLAALTRSDVGGGSILAVFEAKINIIG